VPLPRIFFSNFYIKIVIFRAFWVAISYRLTVLPESEICLELAYNYSLLKIARQNDKKMHQKLLKEIAEDYVVFSRTFPYLFS